MGQRDLKEWLRDDWSHRLIAFGLIVATLSLIVQLVATVLIAQLS